MCYKLNAKAAVCLTLIVFSLTIGNYVFAEDSITFEWDEETEPAQQQVTHKLKKHNPPAHAPAYGFRAKHRYRYYPSKNVYHDVKRELYFYLRGNKWETGISLPANLRDGLGESVILELQTDKPYIHHAEHVKYYPPQKAQSKKYKSWAKK